MSRRRALRTRGILAVATAGLLLSAYITVVWPLHKGEDALYLSAGSFGQLPGWQADDQLQALDALQKSCAAINKKTAASELGAGRFAGKAWQWQDICEGLADGGFSTSADARKFFEENFTPYQVWGKNGRDGLFTGYYEPLLRGSLRKHGAYRVPLYSRPKDLIAVNLGDFRASLQGEAIVGRVHAGRLVPYYDRAEIEKGALRGRQDEIVWVNSAVDAFFLHIQGSGEVRLDDGKVLRVGYAGENGRPYTAIGRALLEQGDLSKDNVSMQSIRAWLEKNPARAAEIMNLDNSYIFFRELKNSGGPMGAEGVPLTARRSMAVDRKKIPYGVPLWISADDPDAVSPAPKGSSGAERPGGGRIERMMIAQDTGGAITGAVRGDFFWGAGEEAAHKAGLMKSAGNMWILLPKTVVVPDEKLWTFWRRVF